LLLKIKKKTWNPVFTCAEIFKLFFFFFKSSNFANFIISRSLYLRLDRLAIIANAGQVTHGHRSVNHLIELIMCFSILVLLERTRIKKKKKIFFFFFRLKKTKYAIQVLCFICVNYYLIKLINYDKY
jgi:hypothetical protein